MSRRASIELFENLDRQLQPECRNVPSTHDYFGLDKLGRCSTSGPRTAVVLPVELWWDELFCTDDRVANERGHGRSIRCELGTIPSRWNILLVRNDTGESHKLWNARRRPTLHIL